MLKTPSGQEVAVATKRRSWVFAPIPISSPALGTGVVPVVGLIFPMRKSDTVSQPSTVGGVGLITDNGIRAVAVGALC